MDRRATFLWAWLAIAAQVFFGVVPRGEASVCIASEPSSCCCGAPVTIVPECDAECCIDTSSSRETPAPGDSSRMDPAVKAVLAPALPVVTGDAPDVEFGRACSSGAPLTREKVAFLTARLRL